MAKIKRIEDLDYYEVLNVKKSASPHEIEKAYLLCKTTYRRDSLAHYGLLSEEEREIMLKKVEEAYQNLRDPKKRKIYDISMLKEDRDNEERAYFRKSTQRVEIADAEKRINLWKKIKKRIFFKRKKLI